MAYASATHYFDIISLVWYPLEHFSLSVSPSITSVEEDRLPCSQEKQQTLQRLWKGLLVADNWWSLHCTMVHVMWGKTVPPSRRNKQENYESFVVAGKMMEKARRRLGSSGRSSRGGSASSQDIVPTTPSSASRVRDSYARSLMGETGPVCVLALRTAERQGYGVIHGH